MYDSLNNHTTREDVGLGRCATRSERLASLYLSSRRSSAFGAPPPESMPIVGIAAATVLAVVLGTPGWWPSCRKGRSSTRRRCCGTGESRSGSQSCSGPEARMPDWPGPRGVPRISLRFTNSDTAHRPVHPGAAALPTSDCRSAVGGQIRPRWTLRLAWLETIRR